MVRSTSFHYVETSEPSSVFLLYVMGFIVSSFSLLPPFPFLCRLQTPPLLSLSLSIAYSLSVPIYEPIIYFLIPSMFLLFRLVSFSPSIILPTLKLCYMHSIHSMCWWTQSLWCLSRHDRYHIRRAIIPGMKEISINWIRFLKGRPLLR